jgi:cytidine deaminase
VSLEDVLSVAEQQELLLRSKAASRNAYCPYSGFAVGAALISVTRQIYVGCNVENAAYSPCLCAERNAVGAMVAAGEREALAVVIYTPTQVATAPCGVCRQVLNEFSPGMWVLAGCDSGSRLVAPLTELLPLAFGPHNLVAAVARQKPTSGSSS